MKSFIPDKLYDILKWCCLVLLPAITIFVKTVLPEYNVPNIDTIVTTIVGINALLGAILGVSTIQYNSNKGEDENDK